VRAETLGQAAAEELAADLAEGVSVDVHAADQLLVYLALAGGGSFLTRQITRHAETAMWLIAQFLAVRFETAPAGRNFRVTVSPV
jgi:RNA 3'-terminal phosphate cyclase (ATP)